jgi:hypothetical protein
VSYAQKIWIIDSNPEGDGGYFELSNYVKLSLQKGQQYPQLAFSDSYTLTEKQFLALVKKFREALPADFFKGGTEGLFGLSSTHPLAANTAEWTCGIMEGKKLKLFAQIFVVFEGTKSASKIKAIEIRTGNEIIPEDPKSIIKQYQERVEYEKTHPSPPLPPPIQN